MNGCVCPPGMLHEPGCPVLVVDANPFRVYTAAECGRDGYPFAWHETLKHDVRRAAGERCVRCKHPYKVGAHRMEAVPDTFPVRWESWTPCDWECAHGDPVRIRLLLADEWQELPIAEIVEGDAPATAGDLVQNLQAPMFVQAKARILTVHHLDGEKANCRWWNLVALCQRDHLYIQGRVHMEQLYPFEHSEWFMPYAAGFYAFKYLGLDLTREEVEARMDELLALERVA